MVSALERQGLVQRQGSRGGIRPGPVLLGLARRGVSGDDIVALCRDTLERLGEASGETIDLAVPVPGGSELYLDQVDSRHFLGTVNWVGRRLPHHCTSVGKVFMAFGAASPPARLERFTPATITTADRLAEELRSVRARGYAITIGELEPGLVAVAAPVLGSDGAAIAAISISGPQLRLDGDRLEQLGDLLVSDIAALSERLGHNPLTKGAA